MILVLAIYVGGMRTMNKEIAQYINELLADRERLLDERESGPEDWDSLEDETKWELSKIYQAQKAMDYIIEEDELNYPPHLRGDVIAKAKEAFAHTNKKEDN